jgi:hypothetical protein
MLYTAVVHTHDGAVEDLMALALFATDAEWLDIEERLERAVSGARTPESRLSLATRLPAWITDGPTRWRNTLRFVADDFFDIAWDDDDTSLVPLLLERVFNPVDGVRRRHVEEILAPGEEAVPSVLELTLVHAALEPAGPYAVLADEVLAEMARLQQGPRYLAGVEVEFTPAADTAEALVDGLLWRLLPLPGTRARRRIARTDEIVESIAPPDGALAGVVRTEGSHSEAEPRGAERAPLWSPR